MRSWNPCSWHQCLGKTSTHSVSIAAGILCRYYVLCNCWSCFSLGQISSLTPSSTLFLMFSWNILIQTCISFFDFYLLPKYLLWIFLVLFHDCPTHFLSLHISGDNVFLYPCPCMFLFIYFEVVFSLFCVIWCILVLSRVHSGLPRVDIQTADYYSQWQFKINLQCFLEVELD